MGTGTGSGLVALFALLRQGFFVFSRLILLFMCMVIKFLLKEV
jgi:hypothetical protein